MKSIITAFLSLSLLWLPCLVMALPKGGNVVEGSATIIEQGEQLVITQDSQNVQINFESFNIAETEQVQFIQPGSDAIAVNLVTGQQMSQLMGQLDANGQVFLINQNGIMVGNGAQVDVAGLLLSSQALSQQDIAQGQFVFSGNNSNQELVNISNQGQINARYYVALISPVIDNAGHIEVSNGDINLISSAKVNVQLSPLTGLHISSEQAIEQGMIDNSGSLLSQNGKVLLSANSMGRLHQSVINNSGEIRATSLIESDGEIILSSGNEGDIINSGLLEVGNAGSIQISGSRIANIGRITADTQNNNAGDINLHASDSIVLASNSHISASSANTGNGGRIEVIAQNNARFMKGATILANAGSDNGDGGFVEVSGYQQVEIAGLVETTAENGKNGEFLIDPYDVTISNANANTDVNFGPNDPITFTPNASGSTIDVATLEANLKTNNVIVQTSIPGADAGTEEGNITVTADINLDGSDGNTLALIADGSVIIDGNIQDLNTSTNDNTNIELTAGGNISITDGKQINAGAGTISLTAGGNAAVTGLISDSASVFAININSGAAITNAGDSTTDLIATKGGIRLSSTSGVEDLSINTISLSGSNSGNDNVKIDSASELAIENYVTNGSMALNVEGALYLSSTGLVAADTLELHSTDILDSDPDISLTASDLFLNLNTSQMDTSLNFDADRIQIEHRGGNNLSLIDSDGVNLESIDGLSAFYSDGGDFSLTTTTGDLVVNSDINLNLMDGDSFDLRSANDLTINADIRDLNASPDNVNMTLNASNDIFINNNAQINSGGGTLALTSGGNMSITGLTSSNTVTLSSGGQIIDNGDSTLDIDAATSLVELNSASGINGLEIDALELQVTNTDNSAVSLSDSNALIINSVSSQGELNIETADALNLANNGIINTSGGDINLNSGGPMELGANSTLTSTSNINLQSTSSLTLSDSGLNTTANLQIQVASLKDSNSEVAISAKALLLTLNAQFSDLILNSQVEQLDVALTGNASLTVNQDANLSLLDLDGDSYAVNLYQGNLLIQLASGNLNINNIVQANDQLVDGVREGMIHLKLSGDLVMGDAAATQLSALNNVDQNATGGLTGNDSTTALYIQQLDSSETPHLFNLDGSNSVEIRSQGGDIIINNRAQTFISERNITLGSQTTIQAYNQAGDANNGEILLSSGVIDTGAAITALSQRKITLIAGPAEPEVIIVKEIVVEEIQEKIKTPPGGEVMPTAQQSDAGYLLHAWFGDCVNDDGWANSCSNFTAIEHFLKRLLIGGALPQ